MKAMKVLAALLTHQAKPKRVFPLREAVERLAKYYKATFGDDGTFSSPELTKWYVKEYVKINELHFRK